MTRKTFYILLSFIFILILTNIVAFSKDIEITFWHIFSPKSSKGKVINNLVDNFNNQGYSIDGNKIIVKSIYKGGEGKFNNPYNFLFSELLKSISTNQSPNVTIAYENWVSQFNEVNAIRDFNSFNNPKFFEYFDNLYPSYKKSSLIDNKIYSLSFNKSFFVFYYNPKYVDFLPTNFDSFVNKLRDLKAKIGDAPLYLEANEDTFIIFYLLYTNNDFFEIKDAIYPKFTDSIDKVTNLLSNLEKEGLIKWTDNSYRDLVKNKAPIILSTTSKYIDLKNKNFSIAVLPADNGKIYSAGTNLVIFKSDPLKEKASEKFVEFLINQDNLEYFCINTGYVVPTEKYSLNYSKFLSENLDYKNVIEYSKNKLYVQQPIWAWENVRYFIADYMFDVFNNKDLSDLKQKELKDRISKIMVNQNIKFNKQ